MKKTEICRLGVQNPHRNLIQILFVPAWIGLGLVNHKCFELEHLDYMLFFARMLVHAIGNFMHEGIHGNLFRNKRRNRLLDFLSGARALLPVSVFGANQLVLVKLLEANDQNKDSIALNYPTWKDCQTGSFLK